MLCVSEERRADDRKDPFLKCQSLASHCLVLNADKKLLQEDTLLTQSLRMESKLRKLDSLPELYSIGLWEAFNILALDEQLFE